jgi:LysM repeat protein
MDKLLLPVPPSKIQTSIGNRNETVNLMNEGEVNIIKSPGLTTFKFDILLPLYTVYPFAMYKDGVFQNAGYYLDYLKGMKDSGNPFFFVINRYKYVPEFKAKKNIMRTRIEVVLENYTITEAADMAPDLTVSIELKEYVKYGTIVKGIDLLSNTVTVSDVKGAAYKKDIPNTYTVKSGDTMWVIAKKLLGDGSKCWNLAKLNNISNPNKISVGQVLKIQDVKAATASSVITKSSVTVKTVAPSAVRSKASIQKSSMLYNSAQKESKPSYTRPTLFPNMLQ